MTRLRRRHALPALVTLVLLAGAGYAVRLYLDARHRVSTDDAYVDGPLAVVSARIQGPVQRVLVRDNEEVREGQVLVDIDPRDYQVRVDQARAATAMAAADARGSSAEVPLARES